jgi:hypothetical protein
MSTYGKSGGSVKSRFAIVVLLLAGMVFAVSPFIGKGQGSHSQPAASVELNQGILKSFVARGSDNTVIIQWSLSDESGVSHYSLYRGYAPVGRFSLVSEIPIHGKNPGGSDYTFVDEWVINGVTYYYKIAYRTGTGAEVVHPMLVSATPSGKASEAPPESLEQYRLFANNANLTTAPTTIDFYVRNSGRVHLKIYDLEGHEVKTLVSRDFIPGIYTLDLTNEDLDAGVYFVKMTGDYGFSTIQKVLVVK